MNLPVDLAAASREELIEVVEQLSATLVLWKHASLNWKGRQSLEPTV